jgi:hypothetical protein
MSFDRAIWLTWLIGTILIVCLWLDVVSRPIGWMGFGAACAASLIANIVHKHWKASEDFDIATYCSFCARERSETPQTIKSPNGILICKDCIEVCNGLLEDNPEEKNQEIPSE